MEKLICPTTGVVVMADERAAAKMLKGGFKKATAQSSAVKKTAPKKASRK